MTSFRPDPPTLLGSRDPKTGQVYFPPRALATDGSLRECEPVDLSRTGVLYSHTTMGTTVYGQIDLPEKVRVQSTLAPGQPPEIGAPYRLEAVTDEGGAVTGWRFARA
ncbi:Zn-ribbon domain-containing OB-fold protein [Streptomyces fuscichromogenes]|uniref:Zn-ribbon domain-containing OB-fold protein n=1 Tax=Streptomyces fuscichromogenes TaxID=1324013 RepID=UPI003810D917